MIACDRLSRVSFIENASSNVAENDLAMVLYTTIIRCIDPLGWEDPARRRSAIGRPLSFVACHGIVGEASVEFRSMYLLRIDLVVFRHASM